MSSVKLLTLVFIRDCQRILLGMKKRGFGAGKWNGFGGKVEVGETIVQAAIRELREESHVKVDSLQEVGMLEFEFVNDPVILEVHVFMSNTFENQPQETEEMLPKWYNIEDIPFNDMWADDKMWFPLLLKGSKFKGFFKFEGHSKILTHTLEEVETLNHANRVREVS